MKTIYLLILIFSALFLTSCGCDIVHDMTYGTAKKTLNSGNAIHNYEYFKTQAEAIKALQSKASHSQKEYNNFKKEMDKTSDFDKEELSRLRTIKNGIMNQLKDSVADYNAKSKMVNRNIFKNGLLPSIKILKYND